MEIKKQIANEITNLEKELEIIILLNKKNKIRMLDEIEIRGASLSLSALYNGMERILYDILKNSLWFQLIISHGTSKFLKSLLLITLFQKKFSVTLKVFWLLDIL